MEPKFSCHLLWIKPPLQTSVVPGDVTVWRAQFKEIKRKIYKVVDKKWSKDLPDGGKLVELHQTRSGGNSLLRSREFGL